MGTRTRAHSPEHATLSSLCQVSSIRTCYPDAPQGTPLSLEVSITDAFATRRRIILSSSFSELKCTPLHCQVMPRSYEVCSALSYTST